MLNFEMRPSSESCDKPSEVRRLFVRAHLRNHADAHVRSRHAVNDERQTSGRVPLLAIAVTVCGAPCGPIQLHVWWTNARDRS